MKNFLLINKYFVPLFHLIIKPLYINEKHWNKGWNKGGTKKFFVPVVWNKEIENGTRMTQKKGGLFHLFQTLISIIKKFYIVKNIVNITQKLM